MKTNFFHRYRWWRRHCEVIWSLRNQRPDRRWDVSKLHSSQKPPRIWFSGFLETNPFLFPTKPVNVWGVAARWWAPMRNVPSVLKVAQSHLLLSKIEAAGGGSEATLDFLWSGLPCCCRQCRSTPLSQGNLTADPAILSIWTPAQRRCQEVVLNGILLCVFFWEGTFVKTGSWQLLLYPRWCILAGKNCAKLKVGEFDLISLPT